MKTLANLRLRATSGKWKRGPPPLQIENHIINQKVSLPGNLPWQAMPSKIQ